MSMPIAEIMKTNFKQHGSLSFAGDASLDAEEGMKSSRKRKSVQNGNLLRQEYRPSANAIRNYENVAYVLDPNVAEVNKSNTRATSINREKSKRLSLTIFLILKDQGPLH